MARRGKRPSMSKAPSKIEWFARGGGIARCGPFESQAEAAASMRLVDGGFPSDVFVWPEETK